VSPESLSAVFAAVQFRTEPFAGLSAGKGPLAYALPQLGGLNCYWSNGEAERNETGNPNPVYAALHLLVLPNATPEDRLGLGDSEGCTDPDAGLTCTLDRVVGDHWLFVQAEGVDAGTHDEAVSMVTPLFDFLKNTVGSAEARTSDWDPPADSIPLTGECDDLIDGVTITGVFGTETPIGIGRSGGGWSLEAAAWARVGAMPCIMLFEDADIGVGHITWLPGGDWALEAAASADIVEIEESEGDDRLSVSCGPTPSGESCSADLAVGHNWVRVTTYPPDADASPAHAQAVAPRDSAVAVAEAILENLRG
jgi:hypothetical protein